MPAEVESMMYVGQTPWHGLGVALENPPTAQQAIKAAGLNWRVEKRPLFTPKTANGDQNNLREVEGYSAVVRKDKNRVLGVVGRNWQPLQNREAFRFFDPFIEAGAAQYHTAGSLKGGQHVWVLAKLDADPMQVARNDTVERYLLLSNSHDGTAAINVRFTPIRVVCWNTLSMAEGNDSVPYLKIYHRGNVKQTMQRVQEVVNVTNQTFEATLKQYRFLAKRKVQNIESFILDVLKWPEGEEKKPQALPRIVELFEGGKGQENPAVRGSLWAAYNGITQWVDHERGRDGTRLEAAWYGEGRRIKQRGLEVATEMAKAA